MVEVRRGLYCDEATGEPGPAFEDVRLAIERAVLAAGLFDEPWSIGARDRSRATV